MLVIHDMTVLLLAIIATCLVALTITIVPAERIGFILGAVVVATALYYASPYLISVEAAIFAALWAQHAGLMILAGLALLAAIAEVARETSSRDGDEYRSARR